MIRTALISLLAAAGLAAFSPASACDTPPNATSTVNGEGTYDPVSPAPQIVSASLILTNSGSADCIVTITTTETTGFELRNVANHIPLSVFKIRSNGSQIFQSSSTAATNGLAVTVPAGGSVPVALEFTPAAGIYAPWAAGRDYTKPVAIRVVANDGATTTVFDNILTAAYSVPKRADFNFAGTDSDFGSSGGKTYDVNFGTLATGAVRTLYFQLRGNTPVWISFDSTANGVLRHENTQVTTTIPYSVLFGTTALDLAVVDQRSSTAVAAGSNTPIVITIGNIANAIAGNYSDTITVNVVPQ